MNVFDQVRLFFTWVPHVMKAVALVELVTVPGQTGAEKKAMAMTTLSGIARQLNLPWTNDALGVVSSAIDMAVYLMNLVGRFRKRAPVDDAEDEAEQMAETAAAIAAPPLAVTRMNVEAAVSEDPELERFMRLTER